ncbi:hypothetical protein ACTL32_10670 [Planococcus sp. FY231025]|uniref:hypothetical protein n=1 Tax=Planococcus sp. FY231025 TaxID=3455699 RepID=UPI003F8F3338
MEKLKSGLRAGLLENPDVVVLKEQTWQLPVVLYDVRFTRVKRLKMDILMKMLLLSFQEADIRRAAALADMLFVEELFIRDLIDKMQRTGLIGLEKKGYKPTAKGMDYLERGIFDEEMEEDSAQATFSAVHDEYRLAGEDVDIEAGDGLPPFRYAVKGNLNKERMQGMLTKELVYPPEDSFQVIATGIAGCIEQETRAVPCIEFQLYDEKQDIFYARVWNAESGSWDEILAKRIEEREVVSWRKVMEEQMEA